MNPEPLMQMAGPLSHHRLDDLLWVWAVPLGMVLLASLAGSLAGRFIVLKKDDPLTPLDEAHGQGWLRVARKLLQAVPFLGVIAAGVLLDRAIHGEPRGLRVLAQSAGLVAGLWAGYFVLDALARSLHSHWHRVGRASAASVLPLLRKVLKVLWAVLLVLIYLDNLGMNVSALLAGLGVGGLAVALAGQKTMENLFGGMVLAMDQPVRVGDFCRFGDKMGTIEELGLRSIKIRTPERTLITVPNGEFSQLQLENIALRDRILFSLTLRLRYDSTPAQLRQVLAESERLIKAQPKLDPSQPHRCRLNGLGPYSLDLEVFCYLSTPDWEEYLLLRQELTLALLEAVEKSGARLAFPTQTSLAESSARPA